VLDQATDQQQGPQAEFEIELLWRMFADVLRQSRQFFFGHLGRPARTGFGQQGVLPAIGKVGQPTVHRPHVQTECGGNLRRRCPSRTAYTACWRIVCKASWLCARPSEKRLHFMQTLCLRKWLYFTKSQ
jgi:hypothetical protein